jgi:hypothetical protein
VLGSVITFHSGATTKDDLSTVLEHALRVGPVARAHILETTTARSLSLNTTVLFRSHARLQPGNQPGVNVVARDILPHYLSFARSQATLSNVPRFGFLWDAFLRALSNQSVLLVNPRRAQFLAQPMRGPGPEDMPVGQVFPAENRLPLVNLDAAAAVVNNFVAAWEGHHGIAICDGQVYQVEEGLVARAEGLARDAVQPVLPLAPIPSFVPPPPPLVQPAPVHLQAPAPLLPAVDPPQAVAGDLAYLVRLQQQIALQLRQLQDLHQQQLFNQQQQHNLYYGQQAPLLVPNVPQAVPPQGQLVLQAPLICHPHYVQQPVQPNIMPLAAPVNAFNQQDFSFFPPTYSMNITSAAQLGKFSTIAGATSSWTRRTSVPLKVQAYPRGNADGLDSKTRSRVFDIPYATNVIFDQYTIITDAPIQLMQRENILECFLANCRAWAQYILPLVGGDPRRLPIFIGSLKDVVANIHHLAVGFGTQECVVLRVCHFISVQNVTSCLTPGESHTLLDPLDTSSNYFQGALTKIIADQTRNRAPPPQHQGVRRELQADRDAPARQNNRQRQRVNAPQGAQAPAGNRAVEGGVAQINPVPSAPWNCCRKFWYGEACFIHQPGQPCRYRHCCRICEAEVTAAEAPAHLRSHVV